MPENGHKAIFFGCWRRAGHFYFDGAGHNLGLDARDLGLPWDHVDGRLTPGQRDDRGRLSYEARSRSQQGKAAIHHKGDWSAIAIHDFTGDSRPGSNSVFFFRAPGLDDTESLFSIAKFFPFIAQRIGDVEVIDVVDDDLLKEVNDG